MIPITNDQIAASYAALNPLATDLALTESIRLTLGTGQSQTVTITPTIGYVLFVSDVQIDNYDSAIYNFVVGNITFDNTVVNRASSIHFVKPQLVGEGDQIYIKVYNGSAGTIVFNVFVDGWSRLASMVGNVT